eukprot:scaffold152627_cov27-Tisochrysis_lutea.AAC.6
MGHPATQEVGEDPRWGQANPPCKLSSNVEHKGRCRTAGSEGEGKGVATVVKPSAAREARIRKDFLLHTTYF